MDQNLEDFLEERENRIKAEKQKQIDALAAARETAEKRKLQFLNAMDSVAKPALAKLEKTFATKGHELRLNSEQASGIPLSLKYLLTLDKTRAMYLVEFQNNKAHVDIAFRFYRHTDPIHPYGKDFSFTDFSAEKIENAIITGFRLLDE